MNEADGQLHTLSVLEQLREASKGLWGASSAAYFRVDELLRQLANPNLHDIPRNLPFRVEMWDQSDQHIRWVIAASASVAVGHAALGRLGERRTQRCRTPTGATRALQSGQRSSTAL